MKLTYHLPDTLLTGVQEAIEDWQISGKAERVWACDASVWTGADEGDWLGWLGITESRQEAVPKLREIAEDIKKAGFSHVLLLGMGGSSLCAEVLSVTFGHRGGYPQLHVLDSTDPAQVKTFESRIDLANTIFIVASKSGSTLEPNILKQYFFTRVEQTVSAGEAGSRFIAVTDPGSKLEKIAVSEKFRHICHGVPTIGGRYSALSNFGMVPAAVMGLDVKDFLDRAAEMAGNCASNLPAVENAGVVLGAILGVLANQGRDKMTIVTSPGLSDFGGWLEQLVAESTGKQGKGIIPVGHEPPGAPSVYGKDRFFVYIRLESAPDRLQDRFMENLEKNGQPVVRIPVAGAGDLGREFYRWMFATAVAGSIMGINPFNQPDVEASKVEMRRLTSEYEKTGSFPAETPIFTDQGIKLFTDPENAAFLTQAARQDPSLSGYMRAHLNRLDRGDYFALLAYVEKTPLYEEKLQNFRQIVRDRKHVATCLGFGPRFLHSTGQAYKGGANTGVFLQITCEDRDDIPVPGQKFTFGAVKAAQALGDFQVLADRKRRVLRVHFETDVQTGLAALEKAGRQALVN